MFGSVEALPSPKAFGSVGMNAVFASGRLYTSYDSLQHRFEPSFRAGVALLPGMTLGADITLIGTFPKQISPQYSTPAFAFGPNLGYFVALPWPAVRPYVTAGISYFHVNVRSSGWRALLTGGCGVAFPHAPVYPAVELGWYHDRVTFRGLQTPAAFEGNMLHCGLRLMASH